MKVGLGAVLRPMFPRGREEVETEIDENNGLERQLDRIA